MPSPDPYALESWHDFFLASAGAAAALTGLLFVGVSLHIRYIVSEPTYRGMARGSLVGLVTVLALSLAALASQPRTWAGVEFALVGGLYVVFEGGYAVLSFRRRNWQVARTTVIRTGVGQLMALIGLAGGLGLIFNAGPGLYAIAFIAITIMVWNLWNAWVLLMGVADEEIAQEARQDASVR